MKHIPLLQLLCVALLGTACSMDEEDRREVLRSAERTNYAIVRSGAVRDLTAPADTGRLIYDSPQSLSARAARATGSPQMWAPFGIATPDSAPTARAQVNQGSRR